MKKKKDWKKGRGWKGTVRAAIAHHPDKFDPKCKDKSKLCPYAIFTNMKKKGNTPHYKDQSSTLKGKPKKKMFETFKEFVERQENDQFI